MNIMRRILLVNAVLFMAITIFVFAIRAQAANDGPFVSNVHAEQRPSTRLVDITYDMTDADGDLHIIAVSVSDDGGSTFTVPAGTFTGDVGSGIAPGVDKHIVWDAGADVPDVYGTNYRVKITASDGQDGAPVVLIPAGEFQMGTDETDIPGLVEWAKQWYSNPQASWYEKETPRHTVYLDAFYIDVYEVTNAQYQKFVHATGHRVPPHWGWGWDSSNGMNQPVMGVTWHDASAYAQWAGKRLPTEAEWEKAARGGLIGKHYPWGDSNPDGSQCNFADKNHGSYWSDKSVDDGYQNTAPVGSYTPNGYGLYDMAGNVREWCADWYDSSYYADSPYRNPQGPASGSRRVERGGSSSSNAYGLRVAYRFYSSPSQGGSFRCVASQSD